MAPRISRTSVQSSKPHSSGSAKRKPKKAAKRAQDAFAIASHAHADRVKVRPHRLGESDVLARRKRPRNQDEEDGEGEEEGPKRRRRSMNVGENSFEEGSDSEGNEWTMGHVEDGDDSDLDSDEAFGESDEKSMQKKGKKRERRVEEDVDMGGEVDLGEEESVGGEEEEDEDDLGEDAIDLATALDQYEESEEDEKPKKGKDKTSVLGDDDAPSEVEDLAADGASDFSSDDDEGDSAKMAQLKALISSLPEEEEGHSKNTRRVEVHESATPSEFGVLRKVDLTSLKPKLTDPEKKKSLKLLEDNVKPSKRNGIARKLDAPLPKRQQDKLDRQAANEKANETLSRWVDTVKHNRRAEHLSFPLKHPNASKSYGESQLLPTTITTPANDLEATIQSILQESGLSNGKDDEEKIQKWEELQTNKLPLEDVLKRRAQLRMERELLFREEVRAKRIKKIKSKSYRRVHRKERERLLQREKDALRADGVDVSEDEREHNDRRRAEERMGAKHRESRWAKGIKQSGRAVWDEDARADVSEMARRNEELRARMEGKSVENDDASDLSSASDDDDGDVNGALTKQLDRLKANPFSTRSSKLASMGFMERGRAAQKARNDEDIARMERELAGEETPSEDEDENGPRQGRQKFGPNITKRSVPAVQIQRSEFEERLMSDNEEHNDIEDNGSTTAQRKLTNGISNDSFKTTKGTSSQRASLSQNPYLMKAVKEKKSDKEQDILWKAQDTISALQEKPKPKSKSKSKSKKSSSDDDLPEPTISAPDADGWQTVTYEQSADENDDVENEGIDLDIVGRNQALTGKAFANDFAGEDIEAEFAAEKAAQAEEEADKTESSFLPGWGSWTGEGVPKPARARRRNKTILKKSGIKPELRKDAKLDKVIINEKKVKSNTKFLATQLPHPFETKAQYERSLRLPTGPEWTTKKTFQDATKPRVIVKQGIIRPISKPLL